MTINHWGVFFKILLWQFVVTVGDQLIPCLPASLLTPRHLDSPARQLWLPPAPAVWRDQNETRSHVWRDLKVRKRYIILNYGCLHSLCQQPWATKTPVPFSSFKQLVSTYIACWNTLSRKLRYCTGWTQPIRGLHSSPIANKRLMYQVYSRVSGAEGCLPDGDVVVVVVGWPDPVEGAGAGAQPGGEPALQHHVRPLHHVLHAILSTLTHTAWKRNTI